MKTGRLHFQLDFESHEFKSFELPVTVCKPNLVLVTRGLSSQPVDIPPGVYYVTTELPGRQQLSVDTLVEVYEGQETCAVLNFYPSEAPLDYWDAMGYVESELIATNKQSDQEGLVGQAKLRLFAGDVLRGDVREVPTSNLVFVPTEHEELTVFYVKGAETPQLAQLLQPGKAAQTLMLPTWGKIGCYLILRRFSDGYSLNVRLENRDADMLLRYREQGFLSEATVKVTSKALSPERLLVGETADPIAAIVTAYTLLLFAELEQLHDWSEGLINNFPSLPDAYAIRGQHLGLLGEHDEALETLLNLSEARGIPLFNEGLSHVTSRLRLYIRAGSKWFDDDSKLLAARTIVKQLHRYGIFWHSYQPFMMYTGLDPLNPDDEPLAEKLDCYQGVDIFEPSIRADKRQKSTKMSGWRNIRSQPSWPFPRKRVPTIKKRLSPKGLPLPPAEIKDSKEGVVLRPSAASAG